MAKTLQQLPAPLPIPERDEIVRLARRYGSHQVARALGLSRHLVLAAAAGLDLAPNSLSRVRNALAAATTVEGSK